MDHYTLASVRVPMSEAAALLIVRDHENALSGNPDPEVFGDADEHHSQVASWMKVGFTDDPEPGVWIRPFDRHFNNDYAAALVSAHLRRSGSDEIVVWCYANTVSRDEGYSIGGGAVAVGAEAWEIEDATETRERLASAVRARQGAAALIARALPSGGDPEDLREELGLDDMVHDHFSSAASDLNNRTVESVIERLLLDGVRPSEILPGLVEGEGDA